MKAPTLKTLERLLTHDEAGEIRARMLSAESHDEIDAALDFANDLLGGFGVEALHDNGWCDYYLSIGILYVNMGDTYNDTLMFDTRAWRFRVGSWGNLVESQPRRFEER